MQPLHDTPHLKAAAVAKLPAALSRLLCFFSCSRKKHIILIRKTLTPTSEQLNLLPLRPGANTITFRAGGAADLTAYVYLLRWNTRLVSEGGGDGAHEWARSEGGVLDFFGSTSAANRAGYAHVCMRLMIQ